jgi:hypothetical protein
LPEGRGDRLMERADRFKERAILVGKRTPA